VSATLDRKVKNILSKLGRVQEDALTEAANQAEKDKSSLLDVLVAKKLIKEKELIGLIAQEINLPPIDLSRIEVDSAMAEEMSQDLAADHGVVPVSKVGKVMTLAVADPFDVFKLDDLKIHTGLSLRLVISTPEAIKTTFESLYNPGQDQMNALFDSAVEDDELRIEYAYEKEFFFDRGVGRGPASPCCSAASTLPSAACAMVLA